MIFIIYRPTGLLLSLKMFSDIRFRIYFTEICSVKRAVLLCFSYLEIIQMGDYLFMRNINLILYYL